MIGDEIHIYDTLSGMNLHYDKHNRDEIHIYDTLSGMNSHYDKHNRDEIHNYDTLSGMNSHCDKHNRHIYDSVPGMMYSHYEKYNVTH